MKQSQQPQNKPPSQNIFKSIWNWQPKKDYLAFQFIRESNIHGIKYITQPHRHIAERVFWVITVLCCVGASFYLSHSAVEKLLRSPVIMSFQPFQTSIANVPFPAVTVCSVNRFRKSAFEIAMRMAKNETLLETEESQANARLFLRELDHICDASRSFSVRLNYSINEVTVNLDHRGVFKPGDRPKGVDTTEALNQQLQIPLRMAVQDCPEMIPLCLWEGQVQNCSRIFRAIITDLGFCCTYNMMPNTILLNMPKNEPSINNMDDGGRLVQEMEQWDAYSVDKYLLERNASVEEQDEYPKRQSKAGQGGGLSFVLDPELSEYFCTGTSGAGFRISVHSAIDWPHVAEFGMGISPNSEILVNLLPDITLADDSIKDLGVDQRHCFYDDEVDLEFYNYYTTANCNDECTAKKIMKDCNCLRFDMPQPYNSTGWTFCEGHNFSCSQEVLKIIGIEGTKKYCQSCLRGCNQIEYRTQTSSFPIRRDTPIWLKHGKLAEWADKNVSIVHVFFGSDTIYSRIRSRLYGFNELFASVGGILGLFLGLSVLSLVEPIYFLFRYLIEPETVARERTAKATTAKLYGETGKRSHRNRKRLEVDPYYNKMLAWMGPTIRNDSDNFQFRH